MELPSYIKTVPFQHQWTALELLADDEAREIPRVFALLPEQGTGKSKILIDDFARLYEEGEINGVFIVAPNDVHLNWKYVEIPTHLADHIKKTTEVMTWVRGFDKYDTRVRYFNNQEHLHILCMNVEALSTKRAKKEAYRFLQDRQCVFLIDESQYVSNEKAKRTKAVIALGSLPTVQYKRIATGTPAETPLDYYSQFAFLDDRILEFTNYFSFKCHYAVLEKKWNFKAKKEYHAIKSYRNQEELAERIAPYHYRILKKDCLDLPEKIYERAFVIMGGKQAALYELMKEKLRAEIVDPETGEWCVTSAKLAMTKLIRLQQITGGYVHADQGGDKYIEVPDGNPKMEALDRIINSTHDKVIIWARFIHEGRAITEFLRKNYERETMNYKEVKRLGKVARAQSIRDFQEKDAIRFFVVQQDAGGVGLTLHAASTVIYYSNLFSLRKRLQSEDRPHRIGQRNNVTYFDIEARGTIDGEIIQSLLDKRDLMRTILKDPPEKWL